MCRDLSYHIYSKPSSLYKIFYFVVLIVFSSFFFFLWLLAILFHMFINIAVKASRLLVFIIIVFGLPNIHGYSSFSISNF